MARDNTTDLAGNVTRDPELKYTPSGQAVASFSIAWKPPHYGDKPEPATEFFDVDAWGDLAENVAASVTKGQRVMVSGRVRQNTWETDAGEKRQKVIVVADDVALSLKWEAIDGGGNRTKPAGNGGGRTQNRGRSSTPPEDRPTVYSDTEPF